MPDEALVFGSIAMDYIMSVFPTLREELPMKDGKIDTINIAIVASDVTILPGGTAGNICFGIGFLGGKATIHSVVGYDFMQTYGKRLLNHNIDLAIKIMPEYQTAHAYMISDKHNEQIILWVPNAIKFIDELDFEEKILAKKNNFKLSIFAPGTAISTLRGMKNTQQLNPNIKKIFDPGQMVLTYEKEQFLECITLADIIIMNDTEWLKTKNFGISLSSLHHEYPQKILIETLGAKGSVFYLPTYSFEVGIASPDKTVEVTGAGDAFRSGLIKGLLDDLSWEESAKLGASLASLCIECRGGQGYEIFPKEKAYERAKNVAVKRIQND
ncbi:MAG: PfkB family carbohydrate kinase [Candidatus Thorarchaeota archaeon]